MNRHRIPRPALAAAPAAAPARGAAAAGPRQAAQRRLLDRLLPAQREEALLEDDEEEPLQAHAPDGGLPAALQGGIARLSGHDLSGVQVHRNSPRPAQLEAHAFAQGNEIHLAPGQEQHLPHEAWHLVQQREGRVQPTGELDGVPVNDDPALEQEADRMGERARRGG